MKNLLFLQEEAETEKEVHGHNMQVFYTLP